MLSFVDDLDAGHLPSDRSREGLLRLPMLVKPNYLNKGEGMRERRKERKSEGASV